MQYVNHILLLAVIVAFFAMPIYMQNKLSQIPTKKIYSSHVSALDSLRGLAALFVCGGHYLQHVSLGQYFPAHQAVLLFFVLSGYVLTISLIKNHYSYKNYLIRRYFRIYPAYYFAIIFTTLFVSGLAVVNWHYIVRWSLLVTDVGGLLSKIVMLDRPRIGHPIDSVSWSLTYEMLISIVFPFIFALFVSINRVWVRYSSMIIYIIVSWFIFQKCQIALVSIVYYSCYFVIGMLLVFNIKSMKVYSSMFFLLLGIICFFNNCIFQIFNYQIYNIYYIDILSAFGATLLIISCVYNSLFINIMSNKVVKFYGMMSYSFYLIHGPMLWIVIQYFDAKNIVFALTVSFVVASFLSYLSYRYIEKPFIKISAYFICRSSLKQKGK